MKSPRKESSGIVTFSVLTTSDRGSSAHPGWQDLGGDAAVEIMTGAGHALIARRVVADDIAQIAEAVREWCDSGAVDIVLTTGGTGLSTRDVTPDAMTGLFDTEVPGIAEAIRAKSLTITPMSMLSRARAGARARALVINLPGNPRGVRECLPVVLPVLSHAADILRNRHTGPHPV